MNDLPENGAVMVGSSPEGVTLTIGELHDGGRALKMVIGPQLAYQLAQRITMAAMKHEEGRFDDLS